MGQAEALAQAQQYIKERERRPARRKEVPAVVAARRNRMQNHYVPKALEQAGIPDGMRGCDKCQFGLVNPPPLNIAAPTYITRTVQASIGELTFCTCEAGQRYRRHLRGVYQSLRDGEDSKTPAFREKVVAEVRAQKQAQPDMPTLSQADIDAALADLGDVHVPTVNGVAYADA